MIRVATGFSENPSLEKATVEATAQALERAGITKADLLILFASAKNSNKWPSAVKKARFLAGARDVVGGSAYGVLTEKGEIEQRPGAAVMALKGVKGNYESFLIPHLQENGFQAGISLAEALKEKEADPSLLALFPDAFSFQHGPFFDGFESLGGFVPLVGGLAS